THGVQVSADGSGSVVDLSALTSFADNSTATASSLQVSSGGSIAVDHLATLKGLGLLVTGAATLALPAANSYTLPGGGFTTYTFKADGAASVLDLGHLTTLTGSAQPFDYLKVQVVNGGHINL